MTARDGGGDDHDPGRVLPGRRRGVRGDRPRRCSSSRSNAGPNSSKVHSDGALVHHPRLFGLREQGPRRRSWPTRPRLGLDQLVEQSRCRPRRSPRSRRGKKIAVERKFMPGYVLAKLDMNDDVYHLVKNTPKVTGFLGSIGQAAADQRGRGRAHAQLQGGGGAPRPRASSRSITRSATRSRCSTARSRASTAWSRSSISTEPRQGVGVDLRPRDPGGAGVRAGRTRRSEPTGSLRARTPVEARRDGARRPAGRSANLTSRIRP